MRNETSDEIKGLFNCIKGYMKLSAELETVNAAYQDLQKELTTKDNQINRLEKSKRKMHGKNQKLGAKVMRLEKELRTTNAEKWNEYKREYKGAETNE